MSITDYSTLKADVIRFTGRDNLSDKFDTFLQLGEAQIFNNESMPLRTSTMEVSAAAQTIGGTNEVSLPDGFLNLRSLKYSDSNNNSELTYSVPSALQVLGSGLPSYYTITGSNITFDYIPDGAYDLEIIYMGKPDALTETADTNVVLTNYPDIYFYACMFSVYDLSTEPQLSEMYYNKMIRSIRGVMKADAKLLKPNMASRVRANYTP